MTFHDLFKQIQDLLYQLKPERFTIFFSTQSLLFGFTELADLDNEKLPMTGHCGQKSSLAKLRFLFYSAEHCIKNILTNSIFLLFLEKRKKILPILGFSRTTTQIKALSRAWKFSPNSRTFQDFQGPWQPWLIFINFLGLHSKNYLITLHKGRDKSKALWATSLMDVMLSFEFHMLTHSEYWSINNLRTKEFGKNIV